MRLSGTLAFTLLVGVACCQARRVVVLPMPFTSHTKYHTNVARELVKLGHEVWLTMPDYLLAKGVLDTTNLTVVPYAIAVNPEEESMAFSRDKYFSGEDDDLDAIIGLVKSCSDELLRNETFFDVIRNLRPDFIIIDNVFLKMLSIIPYRLGVPFAFVGSVYDPIGERVPFSPVETPIQIYPYSDRMGFWQRARTAFFYLGIAALREAQSRPDAVAVYAPEMPYLPLDMLVARAEIWLVEMDHILDYPRPSLPNVKLIGGTATGPAKPLPAELKSFMDSATQGVVVVSFGSYVLNLPPDISRKLFDVFAQLPMKVVFRSDLTSPDPSKVMTSRWLPQNDLLGHPNTKVFVSHCGKNGQYEALYHAVPMVGTPFFSDQHYNAERMRVKGFSETVDLNTVTANDLKDIILKVATDKSYKQAISKASELFRIEFGVPNERAAFWLDHVMKYGGDHMRSEGQRVPYYQFLALDIAAFFGAVLIIVCSVSFLFCRIVVRCICRSKLKIE